MIIYFCLRSDHTPFPQVIASLKAQTIPCEIVEMRVQGGNENTHRTYAPERVKAEQECRRQIHLRATIDGKEFYCVSDWDYKHLIKTNIEDMQKHMTGKLNVGALSISNKQHGGDCDIGFVMYRLEAAENAKLNELTNTTNGCMCTDTNRAIRDAGYKFEYLDNINRINEE